jgi:hypothetical protein
MQCNSPYQSLKGFQTFDEMEYSYEVKKIGLPENKTEIAYIDEEKGEKTIIFVHGLESYLPAWKKNIESLKSSYSCIAIDLHRY